MFITKEINKCSTMVSTVNNTSTIMVICSGLSYLLLMAKGSSTEL